MLIAVPKKEAIFVFLSLYVQYVHIADRELRMTVWDESKRRANPAKHLIDFRDATQIFDGPVFQKAQRRHGEERVLAIGLMQDIEIVVVYVTRGSTKRIISARRAHKDERKDYADHLRNAVKGSL